MQWRTFLRFQLIGEYLDIFHQICNYGKGGSYWCGIKTIVFSSLFLCATKYSRNKLSSQQNVTRTFKC